MGNFDERAWAKIDDEVRLIHEGYLKGELARTKLRGILIEMIRDHVDVPSADLDRALRALGKTDGYLDDGDLRCWLGLF